MDAEKEFDQLVSATLAIVGHDLDEALPMSQAMVRDLRPALLRWMAARYLRDHVVNVLRGRVRMIEMTVTKPKRPKRGTRAYQHWIENTEEGKQHDEQYWEWKRRSQEELSKGLRSAVDKYTKAMKAEWTAELLAAQIAMPDGSTTTWGAATIEQHQARADMFLTNMAANAQGAGLHLKAINDLNAAGVSCLNDLPRRSIDDR